MFRILRVLTNVVATVVELLLVFRLVFKFLVANPDTPFVAWIYRISGPLVKPFAKILPNWEFSNFVLDSPTLVALIVYGIIASLILAILPHPHTLTDDHGYT